MPVSKLQVTDRKKAAALAWQQGIAGQDA